MVSEGWRDPFNKTRELTMPAFGDQLSTEQIREVVTYLKTLWPSEQRQFQWEETLVRGAFPPQQPASLDQPDGATNANARQEHEIGSAASRERGGQYACI